MKKTAFTRLAITPLVALLAGGLALSVGGATAAAAPPPDAVPEAAAAPSAETHGLKGEYFRMSSPGTRDFVDSVGTALDTEVNFQDLTTTFIKMAGQSEHTTARWTGEITAPSTDDYTFYAIGDNGFRLWIDDAPVIDHWQPDWDVEQTSAAVHLEAGVSHTFKLEYFQDTGGASMFLRWSTPTLPKQIVPESAYSPPADFVVFPVDYAIGADGESLLATFSEPVGDLDGLADHLTVESDTTTMPIASIAVAEGNPNALAITLAVPVQKGATIRVSYDGKGSLTVGGDAMPATIRNATNASTQRLLTTWGESLDKNAPLQEYPRPQLVRDRWQNLNGQWEFAGATKGEQPAFGAALDERITVPFPVESQLSGLERHEDYMFYRKVITVPSDWNIGGGERLQLNFGAVDYKAHVWVNGTSVAEHTGGYTSFSADITDALVPGGSQEIIVSVEDTTGDDQPIGKQNPRPSGIVYTASSGIWQTVWIEPVASSAIDSLVTTPDVDDGSLAVEAKSAGASSGATVTVTASDADGTVVSSITGAANTPLRLPVPNAHLWTPDDPYLYGLTVSLADAGATDAVDSYFGMRSVGIEKVGGVQKIVLNGKPIFSLAMLDQGFWPDGLYTAPSDEALKFDLQTQKDLGFNAVRKHIKVEPARWYYHADQIGLLVWQDFVSGNFTNTASQNEFLRQGHEEMAQLHNSPAIIGWIPFNEGWGEWDRTRTGEIANEVKALDPSRLINAHSGVNCCASKGDSGQGDIIDHHDYTNREPAFPDATRAAMDGEHGGFTLRTPGHMWPGAPAAIYSGVNTKAELTAKYVSNTETFYLDRARNDLSGSVYTQVTDLENEINGMWTYDRKVLKVDAAAVRDVNLRVIAAGAEAGTPVAGSGYWALDEGTGTTSADGNAGKNPVTLAGDTAWTDGRVGKALSFDGDGDYAQTRSAVIDTAKSYTVSAWVTLSQLPGNYATAVSQDGPQRENPFYLQYGHGAFAFSVPGGNRATLATTPELGTWYDLVGVYDKDAGQIRLYVDGALVASASAPESSSFASAGPLSIGRGAFDQQKGDWWNGSVDEVRAFDRALSSSEIAALHASVVAPPAPVTPAAVTFDDQPGTANDSYTIPAVDGVEYLVGTEVVPAGVHPATGTVTVTARALIGFVLADGAVTEWTNSFSDAAGPTDPPVTPTPTPSTTPVAPGGPGSASGTNSGDLASTGLAIAPAALAALALLVAGAYALLRRRRIRA